jgi:hypothetical protein
LTDFLFLLVLYIDDKPKFCIKSDFRQKIRLKDGFFVCLKIRGINPVFSSLARSALARSRFTRK